VEKDATNGLVANLDKIAANATNPPPARAMVLADLPEPGNPQTSFKRGNPSRPGEPVPRAFLASAEPRRDPPFWQRNGRLELARAIARRPIRSHGREFGQSDLDASFWRTPRAFDDDFGAAASRRPTLNCSIWLASELFAPA